MLKASHVTLIVLSGLIWLVVGSVLLFLGLNFLIEGVLRENAVQFKPILNFLAPYFGLEQGILALVALCLAIGYMKGRYVLIRSVQKGVEHIISLPAPASISRMYTKKYYVLLSSMIFLGFLAKFLPLDVRGSIDVIIGSALLYGALLYFRHAMLLWQKSKQQMPSM